MNIQPGPEKYYSSKIYCYNIFVMKTGEFTFGLSTVKVFSLFPFVLFFSFLDFKLNNFEKSKMT